MKSSLLLLAVAFVQQILALGAAADEPLEADAVEVGGGEGGESSVAASSHTPANAAAPAGGVI